jgi:hypothetical protein
VAPAAGLFVVLGPSAADAIVAVNFPLLVSGPPPAVEALATEAMRAMTNKLKTAVVLLCAAVGLAGAGAATVWACGGYGPRPAPPVSEAKPFHDRSVETTEMKPDETAAWARSAPNDAADAGTDRPVGAGDAWFAKPAQFVLTNPARDITVVSDRHETFVEFFRRQPVLVATVPAAVLDKVFVTAKGPVDFVFVDKASFNMDGPRVSVYGAALKLAPVPFGGPVSRLLDAAGLAQPVVFVRDADDKNLWHAAGFTRRSSVGFFATDERITPDDFAPADLLQTIPKKK